MFNICLLPAQVDTSVGLDEPLFQPFPPCVTFHNPQAYKAHEAVLYLRNNDKASVSKSTMRSTLMSALRPCYAKARSY